MKEAWKSQASNVKSPISNSKTSEVTSGKTETNKKKVFSCEIEINKDKCKGCQLCIFYCPLKHLGLSSQLNKKGVRFAKIKEDSECTGCGFCFLICPDACIEITKNNI